MKRSSVRHLVTIVSLVATLGLVVANSGGSALAATKDWQKAVVIQPRYASDFASSSFNQSVNNAIADGANYITLVIPVHQSNIYSTDLQTGGDTPTDQSLTAAAAYIHSKGAHVAFALHDDPNDGNWRAFVNPSDRASWFANYGKLLQHYAVLAQGSGTEEFILGTEMTSMTSASLNSSNTGYWNTMIAAVRSVYSGALTYSAQHDGYMSDLGSLGFWPKLDYIGISAYYGLGSGDQSVSSIEAQWSSINTNYIQPIASRYGKQVLFTEIGYASQNNSLQDPGTGYNQGNAYNPQLQVNAYQGLMDYWNNISYFGGVMWWDWSSDPNAGGNGNTSYTPQNKPAEQTMKQFFTIGAGGKGGGDPTPPPTGPVTYSLANTSPTQATVNTATKLTATVAANQPISNALVDLELYDGNGKRVAQMFVQAQNLSTTPTTYSLNWTPTTAGTYTLKGGVFTANWASNLVWNDNLGTVTASNATTTPPPVTPPPVTLPPVTPPPVTPPPSNASIAIWWPGNGVTVTGVQPFKALLTGYAPSAYNMYWQVDGGTLNAMADNATDAPHKESAVNVAPWNWSNTGKYTITFVAKDLNGNVIAQQSTVITVGH